MTLDRPYIQRLWDLLHSVEKAIEREQQRLSLQEAEINKWPPLRDRLTKVGESDA